MVGEHPEEQSDSDNLSIVSFGWWTSISTAEALPILYLISHFMELALKASIVAKLERLPTSNKPSPQLVKELIGYGRGHSLKGLLDHLAELFEPGEQFLSEETREFILEISTLSGQFSEAFRYPFDKKTYLSWPAHQNFSIGRLRAMFRKHGGELNGLQQWLCFRNDFNSEAFDDDIDSETL